MERKMFRLLSLIPLLLFSTTAPAQDGALGQKARSVGYSAEFTATIQVGSEEPRLLYKEVRWISSSGHWMSLQEHVDGKTVQKFAEPNRGLFRVDEKEKKLVRLGAARQSDATQLSIVPAGVKLVRSERLLDLDTDVFETAIPDGSVLLYRARSLNGDVVKVVRRSSKQVFTLAATKIVLGEPDPHLLKHAEYPVAETSQQ